MNRTSGRIPALLLSCCAVTARFSIVGIGEALFDVFASGERLGGAPLNVGLHAHELGRRSETCGVVVSRVGQDARGRRLIDQLADRGMSTEYIETDPDRPTGRVYVDVDVNGQPNFDIVANAAWDAIQYDPNLEDLAQRCDAVCFGTLAQRDGQSRNTIYRFLDACPRAIRMFDVNLRQDAWDHRLLLRSCEWSTIVKLNEKELPIVMEAVDVDSPQALQRRFDLDMVVLTRGEAGTCLYTASGEVTGPPARYDPVPDADAVGAGDACAAAILVGRSLRLEPAQIVGLANSVGAWVASQSGATPSLPDSILSML